MRIFVISDIHGCYLSFEALLKKVDFTKTDQLFLLGDYINRGPRSKEVVDYIMELKLQNYNITTLKGNHEEMIFDSLELEEWTNGETETLESFGINHLKNLDKKYINWFQNLKHFAEKGDYIFVHAGLNFQIEDPLEDRKSMLWINNWQEEINYQWLGNRKVIYGHLPQTQSKIEEMLQNFNREKHICIDNGCFLNDEKGFGNLCCLELTEMKLYFQKNID
jgi:serine/threonine protein phosphatase 1